MSKILDAIRKADEHRLQAGSNETSPTEDGRAEQYRGSAIRLPETGGGTRTEAHARMKLRAEKQRLHYCYGAGLLVALVAGMSLDHYLARGVPPALPRHIQTPPTLALKASPLPRPETRNAALPRQNALPSCIPVDAEDLAYASSHPGWQRYQSAAMEFRVFRQNGSVQAIQVLARQQEPLAGSFIATLLGQVAGRASYALGSRENRGGYLIEKGRMGQLAEVMTYRKVPSGGTRALVVVFLPA